MSVMKTRSVRVNADALRLAERTFAEKNTTFSQLVRDVVAYVASTGSLPDLSAAPAAAPSRRLLEFERWADQVTSAAAASPSYASAPARELLADALEERCG